MTYLFCFVILSYLCLISRINAITFYTREQWGAQPSTDNRPLSLPVPYVVIHHTYIPGACSTSEDCNRDMRSMQRYHMSLDWGDIGYNFCVGGEGGVYEGRGWNIRGIHTGKANNYSVGICLIGDFRTQLPPPIQLEATKLLIRTGVQLGYIDDAYKLISHKQVMPTECPGEVLFEEISTWPKFNAAGFDKNGLNNTQNNKGKLKTAN